jgi:hypothetical protein
VAPGEYRNERKECQTALSDVILRCPFGVADISLANKNSAFTTRYNAPPCTFRAKEKRPGNRAVSGAVAPRQGHLRL